MPRPGSGSRGRTPRCRLRTHEGLGGYRPNRGLTVIARNRRGFLRESEPQSPKRVCFGVGRFGVRTSRQPRVLYSHGVSQPQKSGTYRSVRGRACGATPNRTAVQNRLTASTRIRSGLSRIGKAKPGLAPRQSRGALFAARSWTSHRRLSSYDAAGKAPTSASRARSSSIDSGCAARVNRSSARAPGIPSTAAPASVAMSAPAA